MWCGYASARHSVPCSVPQALWGSFLNCGSCATRMVAAWVAKSLNMRLKISLWQMGDEHGQAQSRLFTEVIRPGLAPLGIEPVLFDNVCGNRCKLRPQG